MMIFFKQLIGKLQIFIRRPEFGKWRRYIIFVFGITVLLIGIIMIVFPGPAIIVIPIALALLGTEFVWAKKLLEKLRHALPKGVFNGSTKKDIGNSGRRRPRTRN